MYPGLGDPWLLPLVMVEFYFHHAPRVRDWRLRVETEDQVDEDLEQEVRRLKHTHRRRLIVANSETR